MMRFDIEGWAKTKGWVGAGWCRPELLELDIQRFRQWLKASKGPGLGYIERRRLERENPCHYFSATKTILVFAWPYFRGWARGDIKVSTYAWGSDYHTTLTEKLEAVMADLKNYVGDFCYRICVDTAPLLEKVWAVKAGLGWQGKNSLLLMRDYGSQVFLGTVLCDLSPDLFEAKDLSYDYCGKCRRCIDACPTQALTPYVLDAGKCISYWNLEHKGDFDSQTPSLNGWLAGCDICQEVCPWNSKLLPVEESGVMSGAGSHPFRTVSLTDIGGPTWQNIVASTALNYLAPSQWERNRRQLSQERKSADAVQ